MSAGFEPANVGVNAIFLTNDFRISNVHHYIAISVYQFRHNISFKERFLLWNTER